MGETAESRCEDSLHNAARSGHEATMIVTTAARARREAARSDRRRLRSRPLGPLDGVPIVWKDLFDLAGTITTCGSASMRADPPATTDSPLVRRVTHQLGMVTIGKTNTSEFAFSGLGINESFGTPRNALDAALIPGGSSSGAAVAVATGIAPVAIGTDTSGSARVPAAFNGCVGYRASRHRYGTHDFRTLSPTLDAVGVLASDVATIHLFDSLLRSEMPTTTTEHRLVIPAGEWVDDCTPGVGRAFKAAVAQLRAVPGVTLETRELESLHAAQAALDEFGTIVGAEAFDRYQHLLATPGGIESATRRRLNCNRDTAKSVAAVRNAMPHLRHLLTQELNGALLICPTVPHEPPPLSDLLKSAAAYDAANATTLRTTMVLSYLGACGISLPLEGKPIGLLLSAPHGFDAGLLSVAQHIERILADLPPRTRK